MNTAAIANASIAATTIDNGVANNANHIAPHSKNAAQRNQSDSPYQGRTAQKDNPAQLIIRQAVDFLIRQVEAGKSETLTTYLAAMARFRNYSFSNILAIARACPTATHVAGIRTWNQLGRYVRRGEKGIPILAPMIGYRRRKTAGFDEDHADTRPQQALIGFRVVYVWDVAATDGQPLAEPAKASGEVGPYYDRLVDFLAAQDIALEFNENIAPALGVSYGGKIALLPGQSKAELLVSLVHELAHELLHRSDRRTFTTATVRETEAEAVAYIVGRAIGLEMGRSSSDYILMHAGNAAVLAESLEVIQRTSAVILGAITAEEPMQLDSAAPLPQAEEMPQEASVSTPE